MKNKAMLMSLLGALLALTSCRDLTLDPVFYALEKEQPLEDDRGFPDAAIVHRIVKTGTRYFAAANKLYSRTDGASDKWTVVSPPPSLTNAMCNTLEVLGTDIYAGFFDRISGAGLGLWSAPGTVPVVWTEVADGDVNNVEIVMIRDVGGELFVSTRASNVNALCHGDGTSFSAVSWEVANPPPADIPITDVARDPIGPNYWVAVGPYLYRDTGADFLGTFDRYNESGAITDAPVSGGSNTFGGLFTSVNTLYVAANNGMLFSTADGGGTWASSALIEVDDDPVPFTAFAEPTLSDGGAVYVGTKTYGYYRIPGGVVTGTPVRSPAYNISALYNGAINCLLYDGSVSPARLFLCTSSTGLWRGDHVSGSEWSWKQE
jgi:hypothetical protein